MPLDNILNEITEGQTAFEKHVCKVGRKYSCASNAFGLKCQESTFLAAKTLGTKLGC